MKIKVLKDVLKANDTIAEENRAVLRKKGILTFNLMSSPGAGKTLILEKTVERLKKDLKIAVIEGDVSTSNDAKRLAKYGIPVIQINTDSIGGACHLDANMIKEALDSLDLSSIQILFIENIGNLICPAGFDLGEDKKIIVLSLTEGEDKPVKYPVAFRQADLLLVNKLDLLEHLDVDLALLLKNSRKVNPELKSIQLSARTGEGVDVWIQWIKKNLELKNKK
ncbi:MAG TPA: hydrogenase nickel incorporation protein HypB [Terriglobales bacterium]|nr:hydrogenase nickel incorporation protein HypB [Terriglobales bacterium]